MLFGNLCYIEANYRKAQISTYPYPCDVFSGVHFSVTTYFITVTTTLRVETFSAFSYQTTNKINEITT